jgi:hypothetical protein
MPGDDIQVDSSILTVLMEKLDTDMWAIECARNVIQYGGNIGVFGIVWDAVRRGVAARGLGNYMMGVWSDTVFDPQDMATYMPRVGKDAVIDGNFHAGSRLSILSWSDFAVVSRPDPSRPDDIYVVFLYGVPRADNSEVLSYKVHRWAVANGKSGLERVVHVDDLTEGEIEMLGFDPSEVIEDEGWVNRLINGDPKNPIDYTQIPITCFVLTGRGDKKDTWQGETGRGRPVSRSVINDRFWKPPIPIWAWEFHKTEQKSAWATDAPDDVTVKWREERDHQWRQLHGMSQVISGDDDGVPRDPPEYYSTPILLNDGSTVEFWVLPTTKKGGNPLNNDQFGGARGGAYVLDFDDENYHAINGVRGPGSWGVWNKKVAARTLVRVSPPAWSSASPGEPGVKTDLSRTTLTWNHGPAKVDIQRKIIEWQNEVSKLYDGPLSGLRDLMSGARTQLDNADLTRDLEDLATEFGHIYTRKVIVKVTVEDPTTTDPANQVPGKVPARKPRKRRESKICPKCGQRLPLPGHADGCVLKPNSDPAPVIPQGVLDWDGDLDPDGMGTKVNVPGMVDGPGTKEIEEEHEVPAVSFPYIERSDWSEVSSRGSFIGVSWSPNEKGPDGRYHGVLRVAWGKDGGMLERYPPLVQAHERLCEKYGVGRHDQGKKVAIDEALWSALVRLLSGKIGHVAGQVAAKTFGSDSPIAHMYDGGGGNNEALLYGLSWALYGIQDLERFARTILAQELGAAVSNA